MWTAAGLCRDNLLANFLVNAITSKRADQEFLVRLISQARIEPAAIDTLVTALSGQGPQADVDRVGEVIRVVQRRIQEAGEPEPDVTEVSIRAREVLQQLRLSTPMYEAALEAEVERDLALLYPDAEKVRQIKGTLMAAILRDASGGPAVPRAYDQGWLAQPGVPPLRGRGLLDDDPTGACEESLEDRSVRPGGWMPERMVTRTELDDTFTRFLAASEPLLVVTSDTGAGVSWLLHDWALRILKGRARLIVPGGDLDATRDLAGLVTGRLRPFFAAPWDPDQFLRRLRAATVRARYGPLVLVIDGVPAPAEDDRARLPRDLARLVAVCQRDDIKVVLACHRHVWVANELGADIPLDALFLYPLSSAAMRPRQGQERVETLSSVVVSDLRDSEFTDMLAHYLPSDAADAADAALQGPAFRSLRNASLLSRYIELHRDTLERGEHPPIPVVDDLLDDSIERLVRAVGRSLRRPYESVERAVGNLVRQLWDVRPRGFNYDGAIAALDIVLPGYGKDAYDALVDVGLLTPSGTTDVADVAVAERLYARGLLQRYAEGEDVLLELRADTDGGVVAALLRGADDPIPFAERLLVQDDRWLPPVADGLAQCRPDDRRILALLTVLTRAKAGSGRVVQGAAARALGTLAAQDPWAYRWVENMYLGERELDAYRGAQSLGTAFNLVPEQVEATVRTRLADFATLPPGRAASHEREKDLLQALTPLHDVEHRVAARVATRLLADGVLLASGSEDAQWTLATLRGNLALIGGDDVIAGLVAELSAPDPIARVRAAQALRPAAFRRPDLVCAGLCAALRRETDPTVINRLLWTIYRLAVSNADEVLDALAQSAAIRWDMPSTPSTAALALLTLAMCALKQPNRTLGLLPQRLDAYPAEVRAVLTEPLAYAWWCCAQGALTGRRGLETLRQVDLTDIPDPYRPFVLRGAALAQLGTMRLDQRDAGELRDKPTGLGDSSLEQFTIDTDAYADHHGAEFAASPEYPRLEGLLLECVTAAEQLERAVFPFPALRNAIFACAHGCIELLAYAALHRPHPIRMLESLPQEWQSLHATWRMLDAGCRDPSVIAFAEGLRARTARRGTAQAFDERRRVLAALNQIQGSGNADVRSYREALGPLDLAGHGLVHGFVASTDGRPDDVLRVLDENIRGDEDLPLLYRWEEETRDWRSLLIARVYARMFDARPIDATEVRDLVSTLQTALHSLPDSPLQEDYRHTYDALAAALDGRFPATPPALSSTTTRMGEAHAYAGSLLTQGCDRERDPAWLAEAAMDPRGLWETSSYSLQKGSLSRHIGSARLYYVFPAVRLALVALADCYGISDPTALLMTERADVNKVLEDAGSVDYMEQADLTRVSADEREVIDTIMTRLDAQSARTPTDERVWRVRGNLLLRLNRLSEAEQSLDRCIALLSTRQPTPLHLECQACAYYDLACVYALTGRYPQCQRALREVLRRQSHGRHWMRHDADLVAVQPFVWFQKLCRRGLKRKYPTRQQKKRSDSSRGNSVSASGAAVVPWDRWTRRDAR